MTSKPDTNRPILRRLGLRIRDARRSRHMTQVELAQSLGISVAYVSLIERGRRNPPFTTVALAAQALEAPLGKLMEQFEQ